MMAIAPLRSDKKHANKRRALVFSANAGIAPMEEIIGQLTSPGRFSTVLVTFLVNWLSQRLDRIVGARRATAPVPNLPIAWVLTFGLSVVAAQQSR